MSCKKIVNITNLTHEEWLQQRRELGIGGSEMAAILGYSKWRSPLDVWLDKKGQSEEVQDNEYMYWGRRMEEVVAEEFEKRTGYKVRRNNFILQSDEWPWLFADIDREIVGSDAGLECKTSSSWNKDAWEGDNIPDAYYIQCQHYMAVTGKQSWWLACLIGGNNFIYKEIKRNEEFIEIMAEEGRRFWQLVKENKMPAVDNSKNCEEALQKIYVVTNPESINLPSEANTWIDQYKNAREQEKFWGNEKQLAKNKLCDLLGEHEVGSIGEHKVMWKYTKGRTSFDKKRFERDYPDLSAKYTKVGDSVRNYFDIK